jgi:YgiT-type zinc finger domain-containing protein
MNCTIPGCFGEYEDRFITHKREEPDGIAYFDNVPAKVCSQCGDTIIAAEVVQTMERILKGEIEPRAE